jgi:hypothetical protein
MKNTSLPIRQSPNPMPFFRHAYLTPRYGKVGKKLQEAHSRWQEIFPSGTAMFW